MNSQQLLIINFIIFGTMVLFFVLGRSKQKQNIKLNLKSSTPKPADSALEQKEALNKTEAAPQSLNLKMREVGPKVNKEVVYFVYNGHEWEAHEVLGIKPGLPLDKVTQHYQHLIKTADPSTFEFYEAAFTAVLRLKSNRW